MAMPTTTLMPSLQRSWASRPSSLHRQVVPVLQPLHQRLRQPLHERLLRCQLRLLRLPQRRLALRPTTGRTVARGAEVPRRVATQAATVVPRHLHQHLHQQQQ